MRDVIVVGAGIMGGVLSERLGAAGKSVLVLEGGPRRDRAEVFARYRAGSPLYPDLPEMAPRIVQGGPLPFLARSVRGVGGSGWHWVGNTPRLSPDCLRAHTRFGVGVDWPLGYQELEPYYVRAERELGVAGTDDNPFSGPRSAPFALPPFPMSYSDELTRRAAAGLGIRFHSQPQARASRALASRPRCCASSTCHPVCPIGAKYGAELEHLPRAERTGRVEVRPDSLVTELLFERGRVVGVRYAGKDGTRTAERARVVVLCAHALEIPRLLLLSGLGGPQVGRHLMDHLVVAATGLCREPVYPARGPLVTCASHQFAAGPARRERAGFILELHNNPATHETPTQIGRRLAKQGWFGAPLEEAMRDRFVRQLTVVALCEQLPHPDNRVELAPDQPGPFGQPGLRVHYQRDAYAEAGLAEARRTLARILDAMGASEQHVLPSVESADHIIGTCRMGHDPATSVVDASLAVHGVGGLFVAGTAVFPTAGCMNPTLTGVALTLRLADHLDRELGHASPVPGR